MDHLVLTRDQVRQVDQLAVQQYGIPSIVLMENAGRGVVDVLCRLGIGGRVVVCCGRGNNAGDGLVAARHLDLRGYPVQVLLWCDPQRLQGDAATNYQILTRTDVAIRPVQPGFGWPAGAEPAEADWIVDGLLGTGASGWPRPPFDEAIAAINGCRARRLAIDVPSGLDCDTGQAGTPTVRADHTCTLVAAKPGLLVPAAQPYVGRLHVLDIGAPRKLVDQVRAAGGVPAFPAVQ